MVDLTYYKNFSQGNQEFLCKVMSIFVNKTPKEILQLKVNYTEGNFKKMGAVVHKLKSQCKSYNLIEIVSSLEELEFQIKANNFSEKTDALIKSILELYTSARLEMIELLKEYQP